MPIVEIEHDGVGRGLRPAMLALDVRRADHANNPTFPSLEPFLFR
jgi:hypothetical protein